MLHGREVERAHLSALVDSARAGTAGALVVLGEPGIGKSALLSDLAANTPDVLLLRTQGLESEAPLAYAALHRLLRPLTGRSGHLQHLPQPQANAVRAAFGDTDGAAEPFLVALAVLSLLTTAAEAEPVVCLVDDAHWLDGASRDAMLFAARRLQADRVAMLFAARETPATGSLGRDEPAGARFEADGVPTLHLRGLDPAAVRGLLRTTAAPTARGTVPTAVVDRLLAETGGNPLALVELPTAMTPGQLKGVEPLPQQLTLTSRVERVFLDRARRLTPQAQTLLLVAVADDSSNIAITQEAAEELGAGPGALGELEDAGLLQVGVAAGGNAGTVQVRHPLVRSAVYQAASDTDRRRAHAALAHALDARGRADRATWHRAAAALEPDEGLAAALATMGKRASRRGGYLAAADTLVRAAELTPDPSKRAARLFAAAQNAWSSGQPARATTLVTVAREDADDPLLVADIDRLRARIAVNAGSAPDAHRIFIRAAEAVAAHDRVRALEMAVAAAVAHGHGVDSGTRLRDDVIDTTPAEGDDARVRSLKLLLASTLAGAGGDSTAALSRMHEAMKTALGDPETLADVDLLGNLANQALHLGDDAGHRRFYSLMLARAKESGDGMAVLYALQRLTFSLYVAGAWAEQRSTAEEAVALGAGLGQLAQTVAPQAWLVVLAALEGRPDYDQRLVDLDELLRAQPPVGILAQPVQDLTRWARGVHALTEGDAAGALHQFRLMQLPTLMSLAAPDRLEAAARAGDRDQLEQWVRDLESRVDDSDGVTATPAAASAASGRALVAELSSNAGDTVTGAFEAALRLHEQVNRPYDQARTELAYGEYLRRAQRRIDARPHLRAALETFTDLRAAPLAERARQELRASGETARKRDPSTALDLTPMELKVARLVSQGLSNKEVAAQCWVSPRTVAFHLRNVFTKTGIAARGELAHLDLG